MSDKPNLSSGAFFAIPGTHLLSLEGRDAIAFAQAQFMNDVAALPPGQWQWSGWLTPKGRVIALFLLLRSGDDALLLLTLSGIDPQALAERLRKFVFRSKVAIRLRDDLGAHGRFSLPAVASGPHAAGTQEDGFELDFGTPEQARTLRICAGTAEQASDEQARRWRLFDLAHGLPWLDAGQLEQWTPQQLSLERLKAFSVHKGCYPGQEIVARTHFLGQAKRGLVRLEGANALAPGDIAADASADARALGQLVEIVGTQGLAVLPVDVGDGPFHGGGQALQRLPLLDGLAR